MLRKRQIMLSPTLEPIDKTRENAEVNFEPWDCRLDIALRLYWAMCTQYPDRLIMLCDGSGRVLEKTSSVLSKLK